MEYLDVVDDNGMPTGEVVSRETAHSEGTGFACRSPGWRCSGKRWDGGCRSGKKTCAALS